MPTIITRGLGYDEPTIIQRVVASEITGEVVASSPVLGTMRVEDESVPVGTVAAEPFPIFGVVSVSDLVQGTVTSSQEIIAVLKEEGPLMSFESNRITMFIRDNRKLEVTITYPNGDPVDLTDSKIWFTVKAKTSDPDSAAKIMKRNTKAGGGDTEIKIINAAGGLAEVYIVPADSDGLNPGTYIYDVQVTLANDETYTVVRDRITFKEDVTREE